MASSTLVETIKAHSATVWSLHIRPDGQILASGSADKEIKFWELQREVASEDAVILSSDRCLCTDGLLQIRHKKSIALSHKRTLKMSDDVLSVRYSPNGKYLAVSLLDSTVKIFYQDSLKFFLSLYGHKVNYIKDFIFPVLNSF